MAHLWAMGTALLLAAQPPPASSKTAGGPPAISPPGDGVETIALADALAELDHQNLAIAQARGRADEADALARQAAAPLVPSLSASGSYVRNSAEASVAIGALLSRVPSLAGAPLPAPIVIQPLDHLLQGNDACRGNHANLTHPTTYHFSNMPSPRNELTRSHKHRTNRRSQPFAQTKHHRVRWSDEFFYRHILRDCRVEYARTVNV